jgi:hypothetical protein
VTVCFRAGIDIREGIMGMMTGQTSQAPAAPPKASPTPNPLFIIGVVVALFIAVVVPRLRRRRRPEGPPPGTFDAGTRDARYELDRLLTDIQDLSREQIAKLDTKIRMLNQLLLECDHKKRELEDLLGRAPSTPTPPTIPQRPSNPLHDQVYSLQDSGKDLDAICSATGLEKGEVELILGLRTMPTRRS